MSPPGGRAIPLVAIAIVLAIGNFALGAYNEGERNKSIAESRGVEVIRALSRHKLATGSYPSSLPELVPSYVPALPRCPGGEDFLYRTAAGYYTLACPDIGWKSRPYRFSSRSRQWEG